jgi:hypothetical protein
LLEVQNKLQGLETEFAGLIGKDFFSNETKQRLD